MTAVYKLMRGNDTDHNMCCFHILQVNRFILLRGHIWRHA